MGEEQLSETPHERRVTWGLMALVVVFVVVMTGIVLWITTSLIRFDREGASQTDRTQPATLGSPAMLTEIPTNVPTKVTTKITSTASAEASQVPILVDATWTFAPRPGHVRFLYWYVKPNQIQVGECIQLTWEIANAVTLQLFRNGELILDNAPAKKTLLDCPTQLGYVVYRMVGVNSAGESNFIQLQVKVKKAP